MIWALGGLICEMRTGMKLFDRDEKDRNLMDMSYNMGQPPKTLHFPKIESLANQKFSQNLMKTISIKSTKDLDEMNLL